MNKLKTAKNSRIETQQAIEKSQQVELRDIETAINKAISQGKFYVKLPYVPCLENLRILHHAGYLLTRPTQETPFCFTWLDPALQEAAGDLYPITSIL